MVGVGLLLGCAGKPPVMVVPTGHLLVRNTDPITEPHSLSLHVGTLFAALVAVDGTPHELRLIQTAMVALRIVSADIEHLPPSVARQYLSVLCNQLALDLGRLEEAARAQRKFRLFPRWMS